MIQCKISRLVLFVLITKWVSCVSGNQESSGKKDKYARKSVFLEAYSSNIHHPAGTSRSINSSSTCSSSDISEFCTPWSYCDNQTCKCGPITTGDALMCSNAGTELSIADSFCLSYNEAENITEAGVCPYNPVDIIPGCDFVNVVCNNISDLNTEMCDKFNRQGTLCGECKDGYFPLAYSFNLTCVQCNGGKFINWLKFLVVAFIPLTIFYFIVLLFNINIASSYLYGFVVYSQVISFDMTSRGILLVSQGKPTYILAQIILSLYGIWSLDFFRSFNLGICLETDTLFTLALDLSVGVYPLLLMMLSYVMINLYDHNFRLLIILWKPFHSFVSLFHRNWDIRTSLVDSFATFMLLSNVKFLIVTYKLLCPVEVYQLSSSGQFNQSWRLFYNPNIVYFGSVHLPYAILAIVVLAVFVLFPALLLVLYPFRCFQKLLNACPVRYLVLHTFMDSFQGCYKDGTEPGTRDCRWFASVPFLSHYFLLLASAFTSGFLFNLICSILVILVVLLLLNVQPFKANLSHYSPINGVFFLFLAALCVGVLGIELACVKKQKTAREFFYYSGVFIGCLPLFCVMTITLHWIWSHRKFGLELIRRWQAKRRGYELLPPEQ